MLQGVEPMIRKTSTGAGWLGAWCITAVFTMGACSEGRERIQTDTFPAPSLNPPRLSRPIIQSAQQVYVNPYANDCRTARAGVLLFKCPPEAPQVSYPVTQVFVRQLMEKRPFGEVTLIQETYSTAPEALRLARRLNLDVVVLGEVPYFLDSGTAGQSGVQVDLEVLEVSTGRQLWFFKDAVKATPRPIVDLIITETRPRPTPPIYTLVEQLAARMADTLVRGGPAPPPAPVHKRLFGAISP